MNNLFFRVINSLLLVSVALIAFVICTIGGVHVASATLLYSASLQNGDYGGGFKVGTYVSPGFNASGSTGGNLATLGIVDSPTGVTFTTHNDVINYSLGADGKDRNSFRTHGAVSVFFMADSEDFQAGQPFVDNYGFNQFNTGQGTFGTGMSRNSGADGIANTSDDQVEWSWTTWHSNVWYSHIDVANDEVLYDFNKWHHIGLTWGGATNYFEVWCDGVLTAWDNVPSGAWGNSYTGLGSAYNFALGEIHERIVGNSSPTGVTFANLEIWDEYRNFENYRPPIIPTIPEPTTILLLGFGLVGLAGARRIKK